MAPQHHRFRRFCLYLIYYRFLAFFQEILSLTCKNTLHGRHCTVFQYEQFRFVINEIYSWETMALNLVTMYLDNEPEVYVHFLFTHFFQLIQSIADRLSTIKSLKMNLTSPYLVATNEQGFFEFFTGFFQQLCGLYTGRNMISGF